MMKMTPCISICFIPFDLYEIHEIVSYGHSNISSVQYVRAYSDDLMYGGDLRYMDVGHRLAENFLPVRCCIILEKNYGFDFVSDRYC